MNWSNTMFLLVQLRDYFYNVFLLVQLRDFFYTVLLLVKLMDCFYPCSYWSNWFFLYCVPIGPIKRLLLYCVPIGPIIVSFRNCVPIGPIIVLFMYCVPIGPIKNWLSKILRVHPLRKAEVNFGRVLKYFFFTL